MVLGVLQWTVWNDADPGQENSDGFACEWVEGKGAECVMGQVLVVAAEMENRSGDAFEVAERADVVKPGTVDVPVREWAHLKAEQGQVKVGSHRCLCHLSP